MLEEAQGGFPLAEGVLQGAPSEGYYYGQNYGYGIPYRADQDPITGRPLLEANPDYLLTRARLTPGARIRQNQYDSNAPDDSLHRSVTEGESIKAKAKDEGKGGGGGVWDGRTKDPLPSPAYDSGAYKLEKMGVAVR